MSKNMDERIREVCAKARINSEDRNIKLVGEFIKMVDNGEISSMEHLIFALNHHRENGLFAAELNLRDYVEKFLQSIDDPAERDHTARKIGATTCSMWGEKEWEEWLKQYPESQRYEVVRKLIEALIKCVAFRGRRP